MERDVEVPMGLSRKRRYSATEQGNIIQIRDILEDIIRKPKRTRLSGPKNGRERDAKVPMDGLSRKRRYSATEQGNIIQIRDVLEDIIRKPKKARLSSAAEQVNIIKMRDVLEKILRDFDMPKASQEQSDGENAAEAIGESSTRNTLK
jgi:hypothetical protein